MALPKKQLKEKLANMTPETIEETAKWILDGHTASLEAVQEERDTYKAKADQYDEVVKERDGYKKQAEAAGDAAKIQKDFDKYKADVEAERRTAKTAADVQDLLKEAGIARESFRAAVAKSFDASKITYGDGGSITNRAELVKGIKADYADFLSTTTSTGTPTVTPPTGGKAGAMTKEQIMAIKDPATRQAEIARNPEAFGLVFSK